MKYILPIALFVLVFVGCSKEEDSSSSNPFDDPSLKKPADTTTPLILDSNSFQFLYHNIFKKTCSNSGCHDGNFEPDFRTVYSSYNTLVNHEVILNDVQNSYTYRVDPGKAEKSLLYGRLTRNIPNTSGIMPAVVDPGSDWPDNKDTYIQLVKNWINNGAPDSYGNKPGPVNLKPQVVGIMAFSSGSTTNPYTRKGGGNPPISIPPSSTIDVWFSFTDDQTDVSNFKLTALKSSYDLFDFSNAADYNLSNSTSFSGKDFWNNTVSYTHKATLTFPMSDTIGTYVFLRTYLQDDIQDDTTESPNQGTNDIMRSYFSLKVDSL